ncbi:hypothetical protein GW17_00038975 [Ensete ventricosum]|nr:hypothetical protein GW17_00038975 [Ensete ventricosum]
MATEVRPRDPSMRPPMVPLATLIGRELRGGKSEKPAIKYGHAAFAKRGEDYFLVRPDCLRVPGDAASSFSVFAVLLIHHSVSVSFVPPHVPSGLMSFPIQIFDGHNGVSAAVFAKEHLLEHVMSAIPQGIGREEWLEALPRALVAGFVKTDIDFQRKGKISSIGDTDVGEFIVPIPHVKQVKVRAIKLGDFHKKTPKCGMLPCCNLVMGGAQVSAEHPVVVTLENLELEAAIHAWPGGDVAAKCRECRLGKSFSSRENTGLLRCAICQTDQVPDDDLLVTSGDLFSPTSKRQEGPYLCADCRRKKDAMEGKRPSDSSMSR